MAASPRFVRAALAAALASCAARAPAPVDACGASGAFGRFEFAAPKMGTLFRIVLYTDDAGRAERAAAAAWERIDALEGILSDYRPESELSRLGRLTDEGAPTDAVRVSDELFEVLAHGQALARETGGAFDVTVGPLSRLWRRARRRGEPPRPEQERAATEAVGYRNLELDPRRRTVRLRAPGMRLDLGGIAKGFALDEALATLRARGIERALVAGGGDVAVGRPPPGRGGWRVELAGERPALLELAEGAVATSGSAERFFEFEGVRYSHLIDPRSWRPTTDGALVTVRVDGGRRPGMRADALASAVAVLGAERGLALVEGLPGVEARVTRTDAEPQVVCTPGFEAALSWGLR